MLLQIFIDIVRLTPSRRRRGVQPLERHKVVAVRVLGGGRANNHGVARGCLDISPVFYPTTLSTPIYIYIFFYLVFQFVFFNHRRSTEHHASVAVLLVACPIPREIRKCQIVPSFVLAAAPLVACPEAKSSAGTQKENTIL